MTLIIGMKCEGGIVLGADGAAVFEDGPSQIARLPVQKKVRVVADEVAVGVAGSIGLGQRLVAGIGHMWSAGQLKGAETPAKATGLIRSEAWRIISAELGIARQAAESFGQRALGVAITQTLVAMPVGGTPCLFAFDEQGAPVEMTEDLPFAAIGSGRGIAYPFLAFLRRIFWPECLPRLTDGRLAVVWTLMHAVATTPGGVSEPIQLVILDRKGDNYRARELPKAEWQQHVQEMRAAEAVLAAFRNHFPPTAIPPPAPEGPRDLS
jgi:20S proteasome alpha/beta subunit